MNPGMYIQTHMSQRTVECVLECVFSCTSKCVFQETLAHPDMHSWCTLWLLLPLLLHCSAFIAGVLPNKECHPGWPGQLGFTPSPPTSASLSIFSPTSTKEGELFDGFKSIYVTRLSWFGSALLRIRTREAGFVFPGT